MDNWLQLQRFKKAKKYIREGDALLDIGCEKGKFFDFVSDKVSQADGIDPAEYDRKLESQLKPNIYKGHFPDVLDEDKKYDVITMLAVLEHINYEEQLVVAEGMKKHLKPNGRLIITVPDAKVDKILEVLQGLGIVDADTLEEHYGYDINKTPSIFENENFKMKVWKKFQLGLNNLFVFEKTS